MLDQSLQMLNYFLIAASHGSKETQSTVTSVLVSLQKYRIVGCDNSVLSITVACGKAFAERSEVCIRQICVTVQHANSGLFGFALYCTCSQMFRSNSSRH